MDIKIANTILSLFKLYFKTKPYRIDYDTTIPKSIISLGYDYNLLVSLMKENLDDFDEWGQMGENVIIPTLKKYEVETEWSGAEYVRRTYRLNLDGYSEEEIKHNINIGNLSYWDGNEIEVNISDSNGDWSINTIEQITESDINRIVKKLELL